MTTYEKIKTLRDSNNIQIEQNLAEYAAWLDKVDAIKPKIYIEIGSFKMGSAKLALACLPSLEKFISIDIENVKNDFQYKVSTLQCRTAKDVLACVPMNSTALAIPPVIKIDPFPITDPPTLSMIQCDWGVSYKTIFVNGDSTQLVTQNKIKELLGKEKADVLFIDGCHTYTAVANDFCRYSEMVRAGGLVGFHDTAMPGMGSTLFFAGLASAYPDRCEQIRSGSYSNELNYGIGIYVN